MPISVVCDACQHEFSAWDDLAGRTVECPKCQANVVVGGQIDEDEWDDEEDEEEDDDDFRLAPVDDSLLTPTSGTELPAEDNAEEQTSAPPPSAEPPSDCPNCGADLQDGMLCDQCGYNVQLKRVIQSEVDTFEPVKDVGFKKWFNEQLAEGESLSTVVFWTMLAGGLILGLFTFLYFPGSLCITIPILLVVGGIYVFAKRSSKGGDQAFYDMGTGATLTVFRMIGWRKMAWPFSKVPFYSAKGTDFGDDDLASMTNAGDIEALDLENCPITDAGLEHLVEWTQLKFLVLKNTQTTREGVLKLQQQLKETMIWM